MLGRSSILAYAALAATALGGFGASVAVATDAPGLSQKTMRDMHKQSQNPLKQTSNSMRGLIGGGIGSTYGSQRRAGYGWTNKHQQRVATKKRNQARHRAACRG